MTEHPRLLALATAAPPHRLSQDATREAARQVFGPRMRDFDRLAPVFDNTGIAMRHACRPLDWYLTPRGWTDKNAAYLEAADDLLDQVTSACLERAGLRPHDVDAIVVASSTGIATPSLDSRLMDRLGFRPDTVRVPVFGLGCCGGVLGLSRAALLARAMPGRTILFLVVELCTLAARYDEVTPTNVVATALFADGAAAALVRQPGPAKSPADSAAEGPTLVAWGEHTWPGTRNVMGWRVEDDGLGVIFSQDIPHLVRTRLRPVVESFLAKHSLSIHDLDGTVCHPGGAKVLDALAEALAPATAGLDDAWAVLRDHGNMSAASVMFVLERRLAAGARGRHLLSALGPGFTAGLLLAEL